jgi:hypothetical protein
MLHDPPTIKQLGGSAKTLARFTRNDTRFSWSAFNPSIAMFKGELYITIRSSNYLINPDGTYRLLDYGDFRNELWLGKLDNKLELVDMHLVSQEEHLMRRGLEDARLYVRDGKLRLCAIGLENWIPKARVVDCELDDKHQNITAVQVLDGPEKNRIEKNWMPVSGTGANFDFMYSPQMILRAGEFVKVQPQGDITDGLRGGGALIPFEGELLGIMHRTMVLSSSMRFSSATFSHEQVQRRKYIHYLVRVSPDGVITAVTKGFYLDGPGVEFAAGIEIVNNQVLITYGKEDVEARIATLSIDTVKKMLVG